MSMVENEPEGRETFLPAPRFEHPNETDLQEFQQTRTYMGGTSFAEDGYIHRPETEDQIFRVQGRAEDKVLRADHRFLGGAFLVYVMGLTFFQISSQFNDFQNKDPVFYGFFIFFCTVTFIVIIMFLHGWWFGNRKKRIKRTINTMVTGDDGLDIEDEDVDNALERIYGR